MAAMRRVAIGLAGLLAVGAARAQLLPAIPATPLGGVVTGSLGRVTDDAMQLTGNVADRLAQLRLARLAALVHGAAERVELDSNGDPARAGEVVIDQPDDAQISAATARGYRLIERGELIGVGYARLAVPPGRSLKAALRELHKLGEHVSSDQIHFQSGTAPAAPTRAPRGRRAPARRPTADRRTSPHRCRKSRKALSPAMWKNSPHRPPRPTPP